MLNIFFHITPAAYEDDYSIQQQLASYLKTALLSHAKFSSSAMRNSITNSSGINQAPKTADPIVTEKRARFR